MRARGSIALLAAALVALSSLPALALQVRRDARDTRGPLDVRVVEVRHRRAPVWRTRTYSRWSKDRVEDRGFVLVYLDTYGDRHFDYYALVRSTGSAMDADLYRNRSRKRDYALSDLRAGHPNRKTARVTVPLTKVRKSGRTYRWRVQTLWTGRRCRRVCFDRAPADGGVTRRY